MRDDDTKSHTYEVKMEKEKKREQYRLLKEQEEGFDMAQKKIEEKADDL